MAETVTVRFDPRTRRILEWEAAARGIGISTLVRQLTEGELSRARRERASAEAEALETYLAERPTAFEEDEPSAWFPPAETTATKS